MAAASHVGDESRPVQRVCPSLLAEPQATMHGPGFVLLNDVRRAHHTVREVIAPAAHPGSRLSLQVAEVAVSPDRSHGLVAVAERIGYCRDGA